MKLLLTREEIARTEAAIQASGSGEYADTLKILLGDEMAGVSSKNIKWKETVYREFDVGEERFQELLDILKKNAEQENRRIALKMKHRAFNAALRRKRREKA